MCIRDSRYSVEIYRPSELIQFRFSKPDGFNGIHKFEITALNENRTEVKHIIDMKTSALGYIKWIIAIRSLHNALIEDGLDNLESICSGQQKSTKWNLWVRFLRWQLG